jgi:UDP-N-acetylglucosamine 2-epimerase (non-hydrolysing)
MKIGILVGHVEAGLRSFDRSMPEEVNRVIADHVSDYLFAPTEKVRSNLLREGVAGEKIFVTGNTIVDAVHQNMRLAGEKNSVLETIGVNGGEYFLATVHRQENVDSIQRFRNILEGLKLLHEGFGMPVVYPVHPRARRRMREYGLTNYPLKMIEPLDYLSFLQLESKARLVLTDSGGVQEKACILRVPCVTLRYNTERPETLEVGANVIAGRAREHS